MVLPVMPRGPVRVCKLLTRSAAQTCAGALQRHPKACKTPKASKSSIDMAHTPKAETLHLQPASHTRPRSFPRTTKATHQPAHNFSEC